MHSRKIVNSRAGPEKIIQDKIIIKLERLGWLVKATHGNLYSFGWPDLYCCHASYGQRWAECKNPTRNTGIFTPAQLEFFHQLSSKNIGVWVLTSDDDEEIAKLHKSPNWYLYLDCMR